jgi:glycosyltransferase involved in cell wall biosynthesis
MSRPSVSVIIPTYNRRELVQMAIDSVLGQTYQDFELIVVDDGSSDGTDQALAKYGNRIEYLYQENAGESAARQRGVEHAQGDLLAFLDSDDVWLPEKLNKQLNAFLTYPDIGYAYCWAYTIDSGGTRIPLPPLGYGLSLREISLGQLLENNLIVAPGSSLVVERNVYNDVKGFDNTIQFAEDWDLCLRLAAKYRFVCVPIPLVEVRIHDRGWLQKRENLERMLNDHLCIIDRFIRSLARPTNGIVQNSITSKANRYARVAFEHLAYSETNEGRARLKQACELSPDTWGDRDIFTQRAAEFSALLVLNGGENAALAFIERTTASLPEPLLDAGVTRSRMFAQAHKVLADYFGLLGNSGAVRRNALRAIRYDPQRLLHRGLRSLLLRSLVGAIQTDPSWISHLADPPDIHLIDIRVTSDSALGRDKAPNDIWSVTHALAEQANS